MLEEERTASGVVDGATESKRIKERKEDKMTLAEVRVRLCARAGQSGSHCRSNSGPDHMEDRWGGAITTNNNGLGE